MEPPQGVHFVARHIFERIIAETPLDDRFRDDVGTALDERVDDLWETTESV